MPDYTVTPRAQRFDGALGTQIEVAGVQPDRRAAERVEGVTEQQQFA